MTRPTHRVTETGEAVFPEGYDPGALEAIPEGYWEAEEFAARKIGAVAQIDRMAEEARAGFLTPGAGQALTYQRKEEEARAWTEQSDEADFPFLQAEAAATDVTVSELAAIVVVQADFWRTIGAQIEGIRMGAKKAIRDADSIEEVAMALDVTWPEPMA